MLLVILAGCSEDETTPPSDRGYSTGKNRFTTMVDGDEREYYVHVPAAYNDGRTQKYVILMTDGKSQGGIEGLRAALNRRSGPAVPVFSITFGDADDRQLKQVSELTGGRVFDGKKDLAHAFRAAKGYN